jgi:glucoamylase
LFPSAHAPRRRALLLAATVFVLSVASIVGWRPAGHSPAFVPLYSEAVGVTPAGVPIVVPAGSEPRWVSGTRVVAPGDDAAALAGSAAQRLADETAAWLEAGTVPGRGTRFEDLSRDALLDLLVLTDRTGATVAGWTDRWRYVWPRDAAFAAVAFARTGHREEALKNLRFLQSVQAPDGSFHARYRADGSGTPDDRGLQEDGPGWALWAVAGVAETAVTAAGRDGILDPLQRLVDRSADRLLRLAGQRDGLPAPSSDYWEVEESTLTLGVAAPMLAGLEAAERLSRDEGDTARARRLGAAAASLRGNIAFAFGRDGYPRHLGGDDPDAALTFVLPPFVAEALPGAQAALDAAVPRMLRPSGGIAPGSGWKQDGISWTPETALLGLAAASRGDAEGAEHWLTWLDSHRTSAGALPEKVLADGSPAAVAPLAWTAATVLLTLDRLDAASADASL